MVTDRKDGFMKCSACRRSPGTGRDNFAPSSGLAHSLQGFGEARRNGLTLGLMLFPGDDRFSIMLNCILHVLLEFAAFYLVLLFLRHYVPGKTPAFRAFGCFIGVILSPFAAKVFTVTFCRYFPLDPTATTVVLVVFILLAGGAAFSIYPRAS